MVCSKGFLLTQNRYFISIKGGNTNTPNINGYWKNITLFKVCHAKVIVWTMVLWKTFSVD